MLSREHLADGRARAVVVNSGNANACTGAQGMDDARAMAAATAQALGIAPDEVVVCSTGVIGKPLPIEAIEQGIAAGRRRALRSAAAPPPPTRSARPTPGPRRARAPAR